MFVALIPPVVSQISPDEKLGARIGAFYSMIAISSLIGTPLGGALIKGKTREGYQNVIIYAVSTNWRLLQVYADDSLGMYISYWGFGYAG